MFFGSSKLILFHQYSYSHQPAGRHHGLGGRYRNLKENDDNLNISLHVEKISEDSLASVEDVLEDLQKWLPEATQLIDRSILDTDRQRAYKVLIDERVKRFNDDPTTA